VSHSTAFSSAVMTWVAVLAIAFALSYAPQYSAPREEDDAVSDAIQRSQAADARLCQDLHGPESVAIQLPDGQHRCTDKHGRRLSNRSAVTLAQKVRP
jgi:hypothetical protein